MGVNGFFLNAYSEPNEVESDSWCSAGLHPTEASILEAALAQNEGSGPVSDPATFAAAEEPHPDTAITVGQPHILQSQPAFATEMSQPGRAKEDPALPACTRLPAGSATSAAGLGSRADGEEMMEALCCPITQVNFHIFGETYEVRITQLGNTLNLFGLGAIRSRRDD